MRPKTYRDNQLLVRASAIQDRREKQKNRTFHEAIFVVGNAESALSEPPQYEPIISLSHLRFFRAAGYMFYISIKGSMEKSI